MKPLINNVSQKANGIIIPGYSKCFVLIFYCLLFSGLWKGCNMFLHNITIEQPNGTVVKYGVPVSVWHFARLLINSTNYFLLIYVISFEEIYVPRKPVIRAFITELPLQ